MSLFRYLEMTLGLALRMAPIWPAAEGPSWAAMASRNSRSLSEMSDSADSTTSSRCARFALRVITALHKVHYRLFEIGRGVPARGLLSALIRGVFPRTLSVQNFLASTRLTAGCPGRLGRMVPQIQSRPIGMIVGGTPSRTPSWASRTAARSGPWKRTFGLRARWWQAGTSGTWSGTNTPVYLPGARAPSCLLDVAEPHYYSEAVIAILVPSGSIRSRASGRSNRPIRTSPGQRPGLA